MNSANDFFAGQEDIGLYALDVAWQDHESGLVLIEHHVISRSEGTGQVIK